MIALAYSAVALLLYIPGLLLLRLLAGLSHPTDALECHYERFALGAVLNGWLALVLASLGIFSLWLHLALVSLLCVILVVRLRHSWSGLFSVQGRAKSRPYSISHSAFHIQHWAFAVVIAIAFALTARPFEIVRGVLDAGVYANTGLAIARTGGIVQHDALLAQIANDAGSLDPAVAEPAAQALSNFVAGQSPERFIATKLRASGFLVLEGDAQAGRVVPQGLHLLPAWIALLSTIGGPLFGLWAPGLLGLLGAWSVGMLGRRLAGFWVGLLAFLLLALNGTQVWFARYSTAETSMQFLLFCGLYFFAKIYPPDDELQSGTTSPMVYASLAGLTLGQIALTRLDFFLVGGPLIPMIAYLLYSLLSGRWRRIHTAFAVALGLMLLHAALHIAFIARAYFFDTTAARLRDTAITAVLALPFLTETMREVTYTTTSSPLKNPWRLWIELAALATVLAGLALFARHPRPLQRLERLVCRQGQLLLTVLAGLALAITVWAYLVRPAILDGDMFTNRAGGWGDPLVLDAELVQRNWVDTQRVSPETARRLFGVVLQAEAADCRTMLDIPATQAARAQLLATRGAWAGPFSNQSVNWLRLQGYIGAPVEWPWCADARYAIARANLVRVGWYLSPLGVALAALGLALWLRRANAASWLFLAIGLLGSFFYVRQTYGTGDQTYIYILRRFVPTLYPTFSLGIAYALVALAGIRLKPARNLSTRPRLLHLSSFVFRLSSFALTAAMLAFFVVTGRTLYMHSEYAGALGQFEALATRFVPSHPGAAGDILLLRAGARDLPDVVATPLRFAYGIDALAVKSTSPASYATALAQQVQHWQRQGRTVYVGYSASGGDFTLPGFALVPVGQSNLKLSEFQQLTDQKPSLAQPWTLPLALYRLELATPGQLSTAPLTNNVLAANDFAAQVRGFYPPDPAPSAEGVYFSWTNGDALLRLPWATPNAQPATLTLQLAAGERPISLPPAAVCLSLYPEQSAERSAGPDTETQYSSLGCHLLTARFNTVTVRLPANLPTAGAGTLLLRLQSDRWIPADYDPRQNDRRPVGLQFAALTFE